MDRQPRSVLLSDCYGLNENVPFAQLNRDRPKLMDYQSVRNDLQWLRGEDGVVSESEATAVLARVLKPLLSVEGYELIANDPEPKELGVDLVARCCGEGLGGRVAVGVEYRHHGRGRPIKVDIVRRHIRKANEAAHDRLLLIGRFGFTPAARDAARHMEPVAIELLDLAGIESWVSRLEIGQPDNAARIQLLIREMGIRYNRCTQQQVSQLIPTLKYYSSDVSL